MTTHDDNLLFSVFLQYFVDIDGDISIVCPFGLKTPIFAPKRVLGDFTREMKSNINETPKTHTLSRDRVI